MMESVVIQMILKCPDCSSIEIEMKRNGHFKCKSCNSKWKITRDEAVVKNILIRNYMPELDVYIEKQGKRLIGKQAMFCKRCSHLFSPLDAIHSYAGSHCCTNCDSSETKWVEFRECPICEETMLYDREFSGGYDKVDDWFCRNDGRVRVRWRDNHLVKVVNP